MFTTVKRIQSKTLDPPPSYTRNATRTLPPQSQSSQALAFTEMHTVPLSTTLMALLAPLTPFSTTHWQPNRARPVSSFQDGARETWRWSWTYIKYLRWSWKLCSSNWIIGVREETRGKIAFAISVSKWSEFVDKQLWVNQVRSRVRYRVTTSQHWNYPVTGKLSRR